MYMYWQLHTHFCPVLRPIVLPLPAVEAVSTATVLLARGHVGGALAAAVLAARAGAVALARRPRGAGGRQRVGVLVRRARQREAEARLARLRTVAHAGATGRRRSRRNAFKGKGCK